MFNVFAYTHKNTHAHMWLERQTDRLIVIHLKRHSKYCQIYQHISNEKKLITV